MTLDTLHRISKVVALRRLFASAGLNPVTMRSRMRRGGPELNKDEVDALLSTLHRHGVTLRRAPRTHS